MNIRMTGRTIVGPLLILIGAYLLFNPFGTISPGRVIAYMWPTMFIIPLSILLHWMYFSMSKRKATGLLIPAGILLVVGIVCQISMLFDAWDIMWPGFILAPAVGLLEFYAFDVRNRWLLVPISVLTVLSLMFFAVFSIGSLFNLTVFGQPYIAVALILIGGVMLFMRKSEQ